MKISTNTPLFEKKPGWIDFDAGSVARGEAIPDAGRRLFDAVIAHASGKQTASERTGQRGIAIFKDGVTL